MYSPWKKSRILIAVFQEFGIQITGSGKFRRFYSDILVDRFYVEGILFELESRLGVLLMEEEDKMIQAPIDMIRIFRAKLKP